MLRHGVHKPDYYKRNKVRILEYQHNYDETHQTEKSQRSKKQYYGHRERICQHNTDYRRKHPDSNLKAVKKYKEQNPEKVRAQNLAEKIPFDLKCGNCGTIENLERHHPDYSKPLMFVTLCRSCHAKIHRRI